MRLKATDLFTTGWLSDQRKHICIENKSVIPHLLCLSLWRCILLFHPTAAAAGTAPLTSPPSPHTAHTSTHTHHHSHITPYIFTMSISTDSKKQTNCRHMNILMARSALFHNFLYKNTLICISALNTVVLES